MGSTWVSMGMPGNQVLGYDTDGDQVWVYASVPDYAPTKIRRGGCLGKRKTEIAKGEKTRVKWTSKAGKLRKCFGTESDL